MGKKNTAEVALGRKSGLKGGPARAARLKTDQRTESARDAVQARWAKANNGISPKKKRTIEKLGVAIATSDSALALC